eukprot:COSAG05_NODE_9424_length_624_cov_1.182857_1_plen_36_part_10
MNPQILRTRFLDLLGLAKPHRLSLARARERRLCVMR